MGYTTFPYQFPAAFNLDGSNPTFPFTFPTVFGLVKARLDVTATPTAALGEMPLIRCESFFTVSTSATAVISTSTGSNGLAVTASVSAQAFKDSPAQAVLTTVEASAAAEALETGRGEGFLLASATSDAGAAAQYPAAAEFTVAATAGAEVHRTATAGSALNVDSSPASLAVNSTTLAAAFQIAATEAAVLLRTTYAEASVAATAESSGEALETGRGEGFLYSAATTTAQASARYPATVEVSAESTASADVHRTANADSDLQAHADSDALAVNSATLSAQLDIAAGPASDFLREAPAETSLAVTATSSGEALETGRGEGFLLAQAEVTAEGSVNYPATADLAVDASVDADYHRTANVGTQLNIDLSSDKTRFPLTLPFAFGDVLSSAENSIDCSASLEVTATTQPGARTTQHFDAAIAVEATASGEALETGRGEGFLGATATTSGGASAGYAASVDLAAAADASADAARTANVESALSVDVDKPALLVNSTSLLSDAVAVDASSSASLRKNTFADASLTATIETFNEAFEIDRGDGILVATAETTAQASAGYPFGVDVSAESTASAEIHRTANAGSDLSVAADTDALAVNSTVLAGSLNVEAVPSGDSVRDTPAGSDLIVTSEFSGEALETGRGEGFLLVTASTTAGASVDYPFQADLAVEATGSGDTHRVANAEGDLRASIASSRNTLPLTLPFVLGDYLSGALRDATVEGSLEIQAYFTQVLAQSIEALLTVFADPTGSGHLLARGQVEAQASAEGTGSGTTTARAQSSTDVTADTSSYIFKDARVEAHLDVSCLVTGELRNDAVTGADFGALVTSYAIGVENDAAASESFFTATPDADADRDAKAASDLEVAAEVTSDSWRETFANTGLIVTTQITAGASVNQPLAGNLNAKAVPTADAVRVMPFGAALTVVATATAMVQKARLVVAVPVDDRSAIVAESLRLATVAIQHLQLATVGADIRSVSVARDVRGSLVEAVDRTSAVNSGMSRTASVEAPVRAASTS